MSTRSTFQIQVASIIEVLSKTAVAEITKLADDRSAALHLEICRSHRENEALKGQLLLMERELGTRRGCGEGAPDNSLNISFEVQVCDDFSEEETTPKVAGKRNITAGVERVFDERLSPGPTEDVQYVPAEKKGDSPHALDIKYEPVDGEQDWSESVLLCEDWAEEEDPKTSQLEGKISEADVCGLSGAAAANGGEGPLCEDEEDEVEEEDEEELLHMQHCSAGDPEKGLQAEMKQEQDGEPLTPGLPLPGSAEGLKVQCEWSKATRFGKAWGKLRKPGGSFEYGGARSNDRFSPRHFRAFRRLRPERNEGPASHLEQQQNGRPHGPLDSTSAEMGFPLGSTPCGSSFDASAGGKHQRGIEELEEFICTCCGKTFPDALELQTHEEQQGVRKWFGCSDCGKTFAYSSVLEKHQRIHCQKESFASSGCDDATFSQQHVLQAHESVLTEEKPHVCTDCGKRFPYKGYLKIHQRIHTREKPFSCTQCGKSFSQISNLRTHQITHTGEKCFRCTVCNRSFAYLHVLKHHQRVHAGENCLTCKLCGKVFDGADTLKQHHVNHHGGKRFSCTLCGKGFTAKSSLKSHLIVHTGEKPHSCDDCGKSFAHLRSLKTHQSVHTGEKPHSCDSCGKSFSQLCNLKTHQRVHTGEKPFSCTVCGKSFSQNHGLQKHILTHSLGGV